MDHKIQNLEHSLEFLQEQHAATLHGLQEEISKLQTKCSSLIQKLAENTQQGGIDVEKASDQPASNEERLRATQLQYKQMKETLENKEERILMLEAQSKSKEQKYLNDLKHYQLKAAELQTELEHKSASIAYLTTKLQQTKVKENVVSGNEVVVSAGRAKPLTPSPPRGNSANRQHEHRKNIRCFVNAPTAGVAGVVVGNTALKDVSPEYILHNSSANVARSTHKTTKHSITDPPRPALGFSQSRRERDMILVNRPKPTDYEDFIKMNHSDEVLTKPVIEPLPPITPRSGKPSRPQRGKTYTNKNAVSCPGSAGEVETVIVESSLPSPERAYRKVQDMT